MANLPTLAQLRHLIALQDSLNFSRAAERTFITQSTLSASIRELESALEGHLVERDKRNVAFTDLGAEVAQRARQILADATDMVELCQRAAKPFTGRLRLSAIPTIAPFVFPKLLPALRKKYPALLCFLREDQTLTLLEKLRHAEIDIGIFALPFAVPDALETLPIADDPFVFVSAAPTSPSVRAQAVTKLEEEQLLLLEDGHCLREHAISACHISGDAQMRTLAATSLPTLVQMVESGLGSTLLPQLAVSGGLLAGRALHVRALTPRPPARKLALVFRKTTSRRNEIALLRALLVKQLTVIK